MNLVIRNYFIALLLLVYSNSVAQDINYEIEPQVPFQPMLTLGSGFHSFQGDILGPKTSTLIGNIGYNAGMRLNLREQLDLSLLFSFVSFFEENDISSFKSDLNSIGLHLDYNLHILKNSKINPYTTFGLQALSYKTHNQIKYNRESTVAIPLGIGLFFDVSERIQMNAGFNYILSMGDIDKSIDNSSDNYIVTSFSISYDLFTPKSKQELFLDERYYSGVDFNEIERSDDDNDGVADMDDYCPKTPKGVKVDDSGCPLDDDNDGIPNYLDKEKDTKKGALVDENGVQLTEEKYYSMYSDFAPASRKYAEFHNNTEIKREDFETENDYLIARANAFNNAYNKGEKFDNKIDPIYYKVQLGIYSNGILPSIINRYLSFDDLESISSENGDIQYLVGQYNTVDEAVIRQDLLEEKGVKECKIVVDNNGVITDYKPNPKKNAKDVKDGLDKTNQENVSSNNEKLQQAENNSETTTDLVENQEEAVYRIQIGAYRIVLNNDVFKGVENVISYKGNDGLTRYTTGSFSDYEKAVSYMYEMRARGFDDAFIVTYKDGQRIGLNYAIKSQKNKPIVSKKKSIEATKKEKTLIKSPLFIVQIGIFKIVSAEDFQKMQKLGNIDKQEMGSGLSKYFAGTYDSFKKAEDRLKEVKNLGFKFALIKATLDGEEVTVEDAKQFSK